MTVTGADGIRRGLQIADGGCIEAMRTILDESQSRQVDIGLLQGCGCARCPCCSKDVAAQDVPAAVRSGCERGSLSSN